MDQAPGPVYAFVDDTEKDPDPSTFETSFFINLRTKGSRKKKFCWRRIQWEDFPPRFADEIASTELPDELELQAMLLLNKSFQLSFWTLSLKTRNSRLNWASFNSLKCFGLKIH
jgi:hypothetical protein